MLLTLALALLTAEAAPTPAAADPAKERLICKRETPIGSLIARRKMCLTKTEWAKRSADGNEEARNQIYNNMGRPACNDSAAC